MALYSRVKTWVTEILTAADLNAEFDNIITKNSDPAYITSASADVASMQANTDPGGVGTESLPTNITGELQRIRFCLKRIVGGAQYYSTPSFDLTTASIGTANLATNAVTTVKITDLNVTTAKLAASAVTTAKITDANVTTAKIADANVTRVKLASVGQLICTGSGGFTGTSPAFATVTNQSGGLTTTGRPVIVFLHVPAGVVGYLSTAGPAAANFSDVAFYRDSTQLGVVQIGQTIIGSGTTSELRYNPSIMFLDLPSAGTYTYTLQYRVAASCTFAATNVALCAYEL